MRLTTLRFAKTLTKSAIRATEKQIEVKAPWGKIAALSWGNPSNPPVLLCPGRFDTCATFRPLVDLLPDDYFYVGVDLPGNGLSDPFPRGAKLTFVDYLQTVSRIKEHFKWDEYFYIGHSLGGAMSKFYNLVYPGQLKRIVELDPMNAYIPTEDVRAWYLDSYEHFYNDDNYPKYNTGIDFAPKYTYEEIKARMMKARGLDESIIEHVLERCLEPTSDGLFKINFDQRLKLNFRLPFTKEALTKFYTESETPILAILSTEYQQLYNQFQLSTDDSAWPHRNYKHILMDVGHDVHLHNTAECAALITEFFKGSSKNIESSKL